MRITQRFKTIMAVFFLLCAAVCVWRIFASGGGKIWYVPCVLVCAAGMLGWNVRRGRS